MSDRPSHPRPSRQRALLAALSVTMALLAWGLLAVGGGGPTDEVATVLADPSAGAPVSAVLPTSGPTTTLPPTTEAPTTTTTLAPPPSTAAAPPPAPKAALPATTTVPLTPRERLEAEVRAALSGVDGCLLVMEGDGQLVSLSPDLPLAPASTQKLLVAATALSRLGPDFRFETRVVARAQPVDGVVEQLWLVGSGDPLIVTPELAAEYAKEPRWQGAPFTPLQSLADQLVALGVREVTKGVSGDDSHFDTPRSISAWKPEHVERGTGGPLGALIVDRGLAAWAPKRVVASNPPRHAADQLARLLSARGTTASGAAEETAPEGAVVVARLASAPLSEIVGAMLRNSDNLTAELLVLELDRRAGGGGSTAGGLAALVDEARALEVPLDGLRLHDGSGLAASNRSTCRALAATLSLGGRPGLDALDGGLAVAGRSGTLINRFLGTPLEGRLAGKTGWISGAIGLVGRLDLQRSLRFAFLANGSFDFGRAVRIENRVLDVLAAYAGQAP